MRWFGCTMNQGDAAALCSALRREGVQMAIDASDADAAVVFSCTVIGSTQRRVERELAAMARLGLPVLVSGCMAAVQLEEVGRACPHAVPFFLDNHGEIPRLIECLKDLVGRCRRRLAPQNARGNDTVRAGLRPEAGRIAGRLGVPGDALALEGVVGIVPIARGCSRGCAYCLSRVARGELRSVPVEEVVQSAGRLYDAGAREIRLTAQDTGQYGQDIGGDLPSLIIAVSESIPEDARIRVGMMNPGTVVDRVALASALLRPNVYRFLHLPVQSASDDILAAMRRGYNYHTFRQIVEDVRARVPGLTLSTDIIVGYPEETEADHCATLRAVEELRPEVLNITRFSARPLTEAARLRPLPGSVVKARSRELSALHRAQRAAYLDGRVGEVVDAALVVEAGSGGAVLRDPGYTPLHVAEDSLRPGRLVRAQIDARRGWTVRARLLGDAPLPCSGEEGAEPPIR